MRPPWIRNWLIKIPLMGVSLSFLLPSLLYADAGKGKELYKKNLCTACHAIGGKGGKVGPALDGIATRRKGEWLAQQIRDSKVNDPNSKMKKFNLSEEKVSDLVDYLLTLK